MTSAQLKQSYLSCKNPVEKTHWQVIWWLKKGGDAVSTEDAASLVGFSTDWIRKLVRRYNKYGPEGLRDKRKDNGKERYLTSRQQQELLDMLQKEPPDKGLWTGTKVARWISEVVGHKVHASTGWRYIKSLAFTLQMPRPCNTQSASKEEQSQFKKNSANTSTI